jgi:hypothetical protein
MTILIYGLGCTVEVLAFKYKFYALANPLAEVLVVPFLELYLFAFWVLILVIYSQCLMIIKRNKELLAHETIAKMRKAQMDPKTPKPKFEMVDEK